MHTLHLSEQSSSDVKEHIEVSSRVEILSVLIPKLVNIEKTEQLSLCKIKLQKKNNRKFRKSLCFFIITEI